MINASDVRLLELICQEVESRGIDIATNYNDWVMLTYGLATDFGEAGRPYFHRLCRLYARGYSEKDCERMYTYVLAHNRGVAHFGSICYLAKAAGIDTAALRRKAYGQGQSQGQDQSQGQPAPTEPSKKAEFVICHSSSPVQIAARGARKRGVVASQPIDENTEEVLPGSEPLRPLPLLCPEPYAWPEPIGEAVSTTPVEVYRDILLLGSITAIGAAIGPAMQTRYSAKPVYPNLQTFVVAPPASGKGMLSFVRRLVDPFHQDRRNAYREALRVYRRKHQQWAELGKKKAEQDEPEEPRNLMFYIPGDNTGTGIVQNLCDNDGCGLLFEVEADTLSSAIKGDYGKFSDVLRKAFDHEGLAYNRRTNQEYRECERTNLSVLISGTPAQVAPLIPSAENGLFSREVFYYMPAVREFRNQFDADDRELITHYQRLGLCLHDLVGLARAAGRYTLLLSDEQREAFNRRFATLFDRSVRVNDAEMNSYVVRLPIDLLRMLSVVALLRAVEPTYLHIEQQGEPPRQLLYEPSLMEPTDGVNQGHRRRAVGSGYVVYASDDDFRQVLAMAEPLFEHALHVLSMLEATEMARRTLSEQDKLFADAAEEFTTNELSQMAQDRGLNPGTARNWVSRWLRNGLIENVGQRGAYKKIF